MAGKTVIKLYRSVCEIKVKRMILKQRFKQPDTFLFVLDRYEQYIKKKLSYETVDDMNDVDVFWFFEYVFTAGNGYQYGVPGKEWWSVTVEKLNDLLIIYSE